MEQNKFLEQLKELLEYAKANESKLTKKEIKDYFMEMKLTEEQLSLVYTYLAEHNVEIRGFSDKKEEHFTETDSSYLKLYHKEINQLPVRTKEEMEDIYNSLLQGNKSIRNIAVESHLKHVVTLAKKYKNRGVLLEDLIQEGNLELISCINELLSNKNIKSCKKEIDKAVKARMIFLVDEAMEDMGIENTILAKTNLIHEATKVLAEEMGTVATIHELSEYTKMNEREIQDIIELSLEEIKLGECDHEHST